MQLLKGCKVHCIRSWYCVCDRVVHSMQKVKGFSWLKTGMICFAFLNILVKASACTLPFLIKESKYSAKLLQLLHTVTALVHWSVLKYCAPIMCKISTYCCKRFVIRRDGISGQKLQLDCC